MSGPPPNYGAPYGQQPPYPGAPYGAPAPYGQPYPGAPYAPYGQPYPGAPYGAPPGMPYPGAPYGAPPYGAPYGAPPNPYGAPPPNAPYGGPSANPQAPYPGQPAATPGTAPLPATPSPKPPQLKVVSATYGLAPRAVDVSKDLQRLVDNKGGLTLHEFGYTFSPNGCMNKVFGDPASGVDKKLIFSYEVVGSTKRLIVLEDKEVVLDITSPPPTAHLTDKQMHDISRAPDVNNFQLEIVGAWYGSGFSFFDVTQALRTMAQKQGGKKLRAFMTGARGEMSKVFGDPTPGQAKTLNVDYQWKTSPQSLTLLEDKEVNIKYEVFRPVL